MEEGKTFYYPGVLPTDLQGDAQVTEGPHYIQVNIPTDSPSDMRARLLTWFETEFFNYEEEPYVLGQDYMDVATLRSGYLPKPIAVTVSMRENI